MSTTPGITKLKSGRLLARPRGGREARRAFPSRVVDTVEEGLAYQEHCAAAMVSDVAQGGMTLAAAWERHVAGMCDGSVLTRSGSHFKPSTIHSYQDVVQTHALPHEIASCPVRSLRVVDLQRLVDDLARQPLSAAVVHNCITALGSMFSTMLPRGELDLHPTRGLRLPARRSKRPRIADAVEIEALIAALPETGDRLAMGLACYGGLRLGEALALRWRDVDLEGGRVRVRDSYDSRAHQFVGTKSSAGVRTVPIMPPLAKLLAEHALACGRPGPGALVLTRDGRRPANPDTIRNRARRAWEEAGLERLRPHQGRHSAITAFLVGGAPGKVVQAVAGHSTITTTMDVYGHVLDHDLDQLGAAFDRTAERARAAELMNQHWHRHQDRGAHALVDAWEKGLVVPSREQVSRIIEVLGVDPEETWALWRAAVAEAEAAARPQG